MNIQNWIDWFKSKLVGTLKDKFDIKYLSESNGDLGELEGVQFDSDSMGGYVYFWSSGYVGYQLMDYKTLDDIFEDTTCKIQNDSKLKDTLEALIEQMKKP